MGGSHDFKVGVQYNSGLGEYTYGPNDYIYTYGSTLAYGYTQLPFTQGGRMKGWGIYADDTYQLGRATLNLGLRYDDSKAYFAAQDLLDANGNPTGAAIAGGGRGLPLARALASRGRHLQGHRQRLDAAEGALRPLLPRHRDRRVRQHHAVDHAEVPVLGTLQRRRRCRWAWRSSPTPRS